MTDPDPARGRPWALDEAVERYGLPMSELEDFGPFVAQRFERAVFERWYPSATERADADRVTLVRIGTIFEEVITGTVQA